MIRLGFNGIGAVLDVDGEVIEVGGAKPQIALVVIGGGAGEGEAQPDGLAAIAEAQEAGQRPETGGSRTGSNLGQGKSAGGIAQHLQMAGQ